MYATNIYKDMTPKKQKELDVFCKEYSEFLTKCKTERLSVAESVRLAEACGYKELDSYKKIKAGDKVYAVNRNKNMVLFQIGTKPLTDGMRILGAHIDSPRLDLKQNPLYESSGYALLDTHYYGGIKKYQWVAIPLALYGVVCKKDGTVIDVSIGDNPGDPVLGIGDLLPHLGKNQMEKTGDKVIEGENLDVTVGSIPLKGKKGKDGKEEEVKDAVKANLLKILKDSYGIEEEDFLSAEIEVVPAGQVRDYGLDRSMIAGYGHDDRVCAYTSLRALLDTKKTEQTLCCCLVDKEEIGSVGATGAHSMFFENVVAKILKKMGDDDYRSLRIAMESSDMLSSDVSAAFDPLFADVIDTKNGAFLNNGIVFNKYTGARGKSGSNDTSPEYFASVRRIMDENKIHFQTAELGKVDQGGGGTIAYILGNYNMNVVDAGIAVLNMHAPMEVVSKADVFETYLAYKAFLRG